MKRCTHLQHMNLHHTWVDTWDCQRVLLHQIHKSPHLLAVKAWGWIVASHYFRAQAAEFSVFNDPKSTSLWEKLDNPVACLLSRVLLPGLAQCCKRLLPWPGLLTLEGPPLSLSLYCRGQEAARALTQPWQSLPGVTE